MRKKTLFYCAVFLTMLFSIAMPVSAVQDTGVAEKITVTDDLDRKITLELPLESVVSLAPSVTEIVCALDLCDELIGVDVASNYPDEVTKKAIVTNYDMSINKELILSLDPELVIISELTAIDQVKQLEDMGLTIYYLKNPKTLEDLDSYFMKVGEVTGHEEQAEELITEMKNRIAVVDETIAKATTHPLVFYELDATDISKPWTASSGTFIDELITRAGGKNVAADLKGEWVQISLEALIRSNPEIIILGDSNYGITPESVIERPGWDVLSAVKNKKIYPINSDIGSRPSPRLVDALEILAGYIHPELFEMK
ncbi:MAG TPA: helical backbone metal receptor [Flexilinea sp.]|nr:helical backbone metal receptor [Flexilinea sp.]